MAVPSRHAKYPSFNLILCLLQGWGTYMRTRAQIVYKFRRISFACRGNVEEQNKVLESAIIIINYRIIFINSYYNYIIIAQYNCYICNKNLLEECDREENVKAFGAVTASCLKRRL